MKAGLWVAMVLSLLLGASGAFGAVIVSGVAGTGWVGGLTQSPPGTAFTVDFAAVRPELANPLDVCQINLMFQATGLACGNLNFRLQADPGMTYTLPVIYPAYLVYTLYDPAYFDPAHIAGPKSPLDPVWKSELSDGVLSGRLWVGNVTYGYPGQYMLSGQLWSLVPEPGALLLLATGAGVLLRWRRLNRSRVRTGGPGPAYWPLPASLPNSPPGSLGGT